MTEKPSDNYEIPERFCSLTETLAKNSEQFSSKALIDREKKIIGYIDFIVYNTKLTSSIKRLFSKHNYGKTMTDINNIYNYLLTYDISMFKNPQDNWFI